jgi:hypothetical protein
LRQLGHQDRFTYVGGDRTTALAPGVVTRLPATFAPIGQIPGIPAQGSFSQNRHRF